MQGTYSSCQKYVPIEGRGQGVDFSLQDESYGVIPEPLRLNSFGKGTTPFSAKAQGPIVFLHPIRDVRVPS